ncbi:MAG: GlsB/YeaQ/YmgE family stress response membrane protein [Pseudomonadota bacterium]|nr:GlsB/YeaQ/YmgE family stress response membrane protein [Pseudomonadota bacterium]
MDWIVTLLVGAFIGWLASMLMRTNAQMGVILDVLVGIVGAALGRWFFGGLLGFETATAAGALSLGGILWGTLGAVILVALLKAVGALGTARP